MYTITREISFDAGHRVSTHGSKCSNLHGHRYKVEAVCIADSLHEEGEQSGMVVDFGFLKEEMLEAFGDLDHTMVLWIDDPWLPRFFSRAEIQNHREILSRKGNSYLRLFSDGMGVITIISKIPTAENLAELFYRWLQPRVIHRSKGLAQLRQITVHETPNCRASFWEAPKHSEL